MFRDADRYIPDKEAAFHQRTPQYSGVLETVLTSIVHHLGSPTQNATLLSTDSPAYRTILPQVLDALKAWHIMYTIPFKTAQYSSKKGYSSKKYIFDTGIANFLLTRLMPVQFGREMQALPMLLENNVFQDCISIVQHIRAVNCYRSSNRVPTELDFVVQQPTGPVGLEVKSTNRVKLNTINQLLDFMGRFALDRGFVVYTGLPQEKMVQGKKIRFIPPYMVVDILQ